jgi:hypothetical protein
VLTKIDFKQKQLEFRQSLEKGGKAFQGDVKELLQDILKGINPTKGGNVKRLLTNAFIATKNTTDIIDKLTSDIDINQLKSDLKEKLACLGKEGNPQKCEKIGCANKKQCLASIWKLYNPFIKLLLDNIIGTLNEDGKLVRSGVVLLSTGIFASPNDIDSQIGKKFYKTIITFSTGILTLYNILDSIFEVISFDFEANPDETKVEAVEVDFDDVDDDPFADLEDDL